MSRNKINDDQVFTCDQVHVLNYITRLYGKNEKVETFLRRNCAIGTINQKTHMEVFEMIEKELGYPIP